MTTVDGLFAAGDGVGACGHKFSSGSFAEGKLAGKSAVAYVVDQADAPQIDEAEIEAVTARLWHPIEHFAKHRGVSTPKTQPPLPHAQELFAAAAEDHG